MRRPCAGGADRLRDAARRWVGFGLDADTNALSPRILGFGAPYAVAVTPDGRTAYVANYGDGLVTVIDTATNTVAATITLGGDPNRIAITPDGTKAYATNYASPTVRAFDVATGAPGATIAVGITPIGIAITPDGTKAYVANQSGTVSVINLATNVVTTIGAGVLNQPYAIAITPDGATAYVTNLGDSAVRPITVATNAIGLPITGGFNSPNGIAITPDGTKAYVTNQNLAAVIPIAVATNTAGANIPTIGGSFGIAFAAPPRPAGSTGSTIAGRGCTAPSPTALTPNSGAAGSFVRITGVGFACATGVRIGGVDTAYSVESDNEITAVVPLGQDGSVDVRVLGSRVPTGALAGRFTYDPSPASAASGRTLSCGRVPTLKGYTEARSKKVLTRDGCASATVHYRSAGTRRHGHRRVSGQSVKPGTPLYAGDTLTVTLR